LLSYSVYDALCLKIVQGIIAWEPGPCRRWCAAMGYLESNLYLIDIPSILFRCSTY
jgi:hypothetical protein